VLTCPWHGWTFDLRTGTCDEDPDLTLELYPVRIDGDDIVVTF
jgi:nitrite reductase (NADH) small subunit